MNADYLLREWNGSRCLAILFAFNYSELLQRSLLETMLSKGPLTQTPFYSLQTIHLLFYYHLAILEIEDKELGRGLLINEETVHELLQILDQVSIEKFPIPLSAKFLTFIKYFEAYGKMLVEENLTDTQLRPYSNSANLLQQIGGYNGGLNQQFFKSIDELYNSMKVTFYNHPKFKKWFEKLSDLIEMSSAIENEAEIYVNTLRTTLAATAVQAD